MSKLTEEEKAERKAKQEARAEALKQAQIKEAIKLMEILKFNDHVIDNFKKGILTELILKKQIDPITKEKSYLQILTTPDEEILNRIHQLEDQYKFKTYYVMENQTEFGKLISLLIVCKQKNEWIIDEEAAADETEKYKEMFSYVINLDDELLSEFGYIGIEKINDEYTRTY